MEHHPENERDADAADFPFGDVLESMTDGFIALDRNWRIIYVNAAAERTNGVTRESILGKTHWEAFPAVLNTDFERALRQAMAERVPVRSECFYEPYGRWYEIDVHPIKNDGLAFYGRDITERKQAEEKLRESEQRFRSMADGSPMMIWITDAAGRIEFANRTYLNFFGISQERAAEFDWSEIVHPHDRDSYIAAFTTAVGQRQPLQVRARVRRRDGQWRWIESRGNPRRDATGRVTGFIGSSPDMTEIYDAQEALQQADRNKDEFLATLAHELRNPLAPIRNSLHILRLSGDAGPATAQIHDMIERQVNQMVRLVDDLLEVSRITRGKIELRKEHVELAAVVRSAVETSKPAIEDNGQHLIVSLPPEPVSLDGDSIRLAQVFGNLLNNAAKYTEPGGQIWLTAQQEGDVIAVSVRDSGIGIPSDMLPRIFDMFTQVDHSMDRAHGGLGIGLTLVHSLVEMHGGTVEARSDGPGKGSEFIVRLPLLPAPASEILRPVQRAVGALPARRVLVVDDNRDAADSLGMFLKLAGAKVAVVYHGLAALEALESFKPEVVLLDIGMPEIDGYEVARRIRQNPDYRDVLLVALTGWGQEEDRRRSRAAGFDHHLVKPADIDLLQSLLALPENPRTEVTRH
jgi:PAS domain S-box-containing protein